MTMPSPPPSPTDMDQSSLARARSAALAELRRQPMAMPWSREAWLFMGFLALVTATTAVGAAAIPIFGPGRFPVKAAELTLLLATQLVGAWAAVAPRGRWLSPLALGLGLAALGTLVAARAGDVSPSLLPGWVCSATHLGVGLIPLLGAVVIVRRGAFRWDRAIAAGLAAGAMGAMMGELCCERGATHALVHHGGAWLVVTIAVALLARALRPRHFAP